MASILDGLGIEGSVLEIVDLPRSETLKEWLAIARRIIRDTIAEVKLDPAEEDKVIDTFTGAGLF